MHLHDSATIISLGLTVVYLQYAWKILSEWYYSTSDIMRKRRKNWEGTHWLILGIFVGFIAGFADNFISGAIWVADYLQLPFAEEWMHAGVYSNLFFHTGLGIVSAFAHIKAALLWNNKAPDLNHALIWGAGALFSVSLFTVKLLLDA